MDLVLLGPLKYNSYKKLREIKSVISYKVVG